jgi:WhiB family redox-sensing transcriptional regulator
MIDTTVTWRERAACRGSDPDIFYPVNEDEADEAIAICMVCPVREPCLEYALTARERYGVWGATTEKDRRRIWRKRRRSA